MPTPPPIGRKWTDEQRDEALALYTEHGPAETSRRTGIPVKTIASWARRYKVPSRQVANTSKAIKVAAMKWAERKIRLADKAGALAELMAMRAETERVPRDAKLLVEAMEKAAGVAQLLSGGATSRPEGSVDSPEGRLALVREIQGDIAKRQGAEEQTG